MPTPDAYAGERGGSQSPEKRRAGGHAVSLADVVEHELLPKVAASESANTAENHLRTTVAKSDFGKFAPAIERWAETIERDAPAPLAPAGKNGQMRLSPLFTEWMMGLPAGHVTGHGLSRNEELKLCGNGVVPQQALLALSVLATAVEEETE